MANKKLSLLDCTLRDGGYRNNWNFGQQAIDEIITSIDEAGIEYIELGFLHTDFEDSVDTAKYSCPTSTPVIPNASQQTKHVCMLRHGDYDAQDLPDRNTTNIYGIRYSFPELYADTIINQINLIANKGYKVFVQPCSTKYFDPEVIDTVIKNLPHEKIAAFSIVDTLGTYLPQEIINTILQLDKKLPPSIPLGLHFHDNLSLATANIMAALSVDTSREYIIDSCITGYGRGGGNLRTEILLHLLNTKYNITYRIEPILDIIDKHFLKEREKTIYSLTAALECHPTLANDFLFHPNKKLVELYNTLSDIPLSQRRRSLNTRLKSAS